ncbi:conserved hypothetical protein [Rhodospirillaceae bacterium LM-1]|nr:conserved hypothetical protein [Rhodospirillaceae bacterium LM-1]
MTDKLAAAEALFEAGQLMEAQAAFWSQLRTNPRQPKAWSRLGEIALKLGQPAQAFDFFGNGYDFSPDDFDIRLGLGRSLASLGRDNEAITHFRKAALIDPNSKQAHLGLAMAMTAVNDVDGAIMAWRNYLSIDENDPAAMTALAELLMRKLRFDEAEHLLHFAALLDPENPLPLVMQGNVKLAHHDHAAAQALYLKALDIAPGHAPALFNLGNLAMTADDFEMAAGLFAMAHQQAPQDPRLANNLAIALKEQGLLDLAQDMLRQAIANQPDFAEAHWNLATIHFLQGRWKEGFEEAEWRWDMSNFTTPRRDFACPAWDGKPMPKGTLLVHAEQGLGDSFQFVRYVPKLASLAGRVVLEADPKQASLFARSFPSISIVERGQPLPQASAHAALLSLPHFLGAPLESGPYLTPDPTRVAGWKKRLAGLGPGPWVGIVWQGNPGYHADRRRSPGLAPLLPLLDISGIRLVSLQNGIGREQLLRLSEGPIDLGNEEDPDVGPGFEGTAALVAALDLIISADTAIAHLAGALGKPFWLLLPFIPDWRWRMEGSGSPWYPSATLFRQPKAGDWATPVSAIAERLRRLDV